MTNSPSVLFILPSTAIGGAETRYATLMIKMQRFRPVVLTYRANASLFEAQGIRSYYFEDFGFPEAMPITFHSIRTFLIAIRAILSIERIDALFGVMHIGTFYAAVARDLLGLRQPLIGSILGHLSSYFRFSGHRLSSLEKIFLRYLVRRPARLIVSSHGVRDDLIEGFGAPDNRVSVVPNGVDLRRIVRQSYAPCPELSPHDGKTIVMVARLCPGKDFMTLFESVAQLRESIDVRLVLVGEGDYKDSLVKRVEELKLEGYVQFAGYQSNPFRFVRRADVFVLSSFHEGFGNVLVEAMALGIPVIASDCPSGPREIIHHAHDGYLFRVGDRNALTLLLKQVLTSPALHHQLAEAALRRAHDFDADHMVSRYEDIMAEFITTAGYA